MQKLISHMVTTPSFDDLPSFVASLASKIDSLVLQKHTESLSPELPINIKRAAQILGLAKQTIYQNLEIPRHKKGGKLFFFESEILNWIKSGKRKNSFIIDAQVDAAIYSNKK